MQVMNIMDIVAFNGVCLWNEREKKHGSRKHPMRFMHIHWSMWSSDQIIPVIICNWAWKYRARWFEYKGYTITG